MKRILITLLVFTLFLTGASAMSESDLLAKLTTSYDINGYTFQLSGGDKALAKRYLDENELSSKDADYIAGKIDEAISLMRKSGAKDFSDFGKLPSSLKSSLKKLVQDVASNTSVKATVTKGKVVIYNADGTVFAEISKLVKNTGSEFEIIPLVALFVSIIGIVVVYKNVKANA
ncbi:MAG: hypothetical protein IKF91_03915 [Bacilli bacterium]|nr:hypothetical protein [Bacilli bacterium]